MYSVYKHTSPNGKCYIGLTKQDPKKRWQNGLGYRTQELFYRAICKYGWNNFKHEIVATGLTLEQAEDLEKKLISEYKSYDKHFGYNVEHGGNAKKEVSPETLAKFKKICETEEYKAKILEANRRRWSRPGERERMSQMFSGERNPMYGKKLSEEHKRKFVEAGRKAERKYLRGEDNPMYGKHLSEEAKRKISEVNKGTNNWKAKKVMCVETNTIYGCVRDAYRETGIHFSSISKCCLGVTHRAGGYHWQYVEEV